jgi:hypothetical protein
MQIHKSLIALCTVAIAIGTLFAVEYNTQVRPTTTGYLIGSAADQAIGFWGVTPVVQQTIAAVTDNSGGATADGTIGAITTGTPADLAAQAAINTQIRDAVKELSTQVNLIRTKFINEGLLAAP